ncbi:MAG: MATE family efflux transporter [Clostridiales bacterium]|nr:MATE family efflux transporter [Clostridiales bacterium]
MRKRDLVQNNRGIVEGVIWKQLLIYFFPILLGTFFQQLYNTVDAVVVGNYLGKEALAAVGGATGTIINLLVGFFVGLSSGATVVISQYFGSGDEEGVSRAVHTSIALSLAGGIFLTFVGIFGARWALEMMGTTADVIGGATDYMRIYFAGVIMNLLYNMSSGILRAIGDSRRPMIYLIICCLVNIVLDILFVGFMHMGVAGAAIATISSQAVSAILTMRALMRTEECYKFVIKKLRVDFPLLGRILRIGFPAGIQSMMYSISNLLIQANINALGTDTMAAWTAFGKVDSIIWMVMGAFSVSVTTFVGQNWGAGKVDRVKTSIRTGMVVELLSTLIMSGVILLTGQHLIRLFTQDEGVIAISLMIMHCNVPLYASFVPIDLLSGGMRGMGNSLAPMLIICFGVCIFRVVWLFTAVPLNNNIITIVLSYPISWILTSIVMIIYYMHWSKKAGLRAPKASAAA